MREEDVGARPEARPLLAVSLLVWPLKRLTAAAAEFCGTRTTDGPVKASAR